MPHRHAAKVALLVNALAGERHIPHQHASPTERNRDVPMSLSEKKKKRLLTLIIVLSLILMGLVTWLVGKPLVVSCERSQRLSGLGGHPWDLGTGPVCGYGDFSGSGCLDFLAQPLEIAGGYAFGAWEGTLLCLLGATLGSTLVFLVVRRWGVRVLESDLPGKRLNLSNLCKTPQKCGLWPSSSCSSPAHPKTSSATAWG